MMATQFQPSTPEPVLTVSELTAEIKDVLETAFGSVWVCGEISNFSRPSSGHCYFTLKDDAAQLRAVIWRTAANRLTCDLADGLEVICQGNLDLYPPRGSYQLVVERLLPKGLGALERALRQLREKLAAEGLFDKKHKKTLPAFPRRVAFVTSPTGAAIRDFLQVARRRWQGTDLWIVPVRVQGPGASQEIAAAIAAVNRLADPPDVLVIGRGGGSLEDLWAFNEEVVVRAIFASKIPVVSAVGHEIDVTLSDLVADVRALTPSEAAERVVPSADDVRHRLAEHRQRLVAALRGWATHARSRLMSLAAHGVFRRPLDRVRLLSQRVDELHGRQGRALDNLLAIARRRTDALGGRLAALNPTAVLKRGYSITRRTRDGALVRTASDAAPGERLSTRVADGEISSRVE
jgi:exodeoxyribonuclease VII large subunit